MPTVDHILGRLVVIVALVLSTTTPAYAQHSTSSSDDPSAPAEQKSYDDEQKETSDQEDEHEDDREEGPELPEGKTLEEVLDRAEQPPPEGYPDPVPDDKLHAFLLGDQLEYRFDPAGGPDRVGTELQGWFGGDYNRLWLKLEGETSWQGEGFEGETETDLLYGRLVTPFWTLQVGAQYANEWTEDRYEDTLAGALALQGLAPGKFEVDASAYLTENVNFLFDLEAEYDLRITQRLVLQPRSELSFSAQEIPERGIGAGLTRAVVDLRLRYEFLRELAPYVGARYQTLVGETGDLAEAAGEGRNQLLLVGGIRFAVF
jgi:copper resistance protein B